MKRLTVDWHALEMAFEDHPGEFGVERTNYFDLGNGEVVFVDEQVSSTVNCIIDELAAALDEGADWTDDAIRGTDTFQQLSEAEQTSVLAAIKIDYGDASQFEAISHFDAHESYECMRDFIETVSDDTIRGRLNEAIAQRKPFRRFRDVLAGDRRLERQWREFEGLRQRETIIEWLHTIGVEPANPESTTYNPSPLPDLRKIMFAEVRRFTRFARDIDGVRRIALLGSLATDKEFPKDIDLLVTVIAFRCLSGQLLPPREFSGGIRSGSAVANKLPMLSNDFRRQSASDSSDKLGRELHAIQRWTVRRA